MTCDQRHDPRGLRGPSCLPVLRVPQLLVEAEYVNHPNLWLRGTDVRNDSGRPLSSPQAGSAGDTHLLPNVRDGTLARRAVRGLRVRPPTAPDPPAGRATRSLHPGRPRV